MKKLKDIRQENYVSHAQRKAVWAARNDEKEKANEAKDGDGANIVRDREFKEPKFKFKSHPYGSPEWHANKAEYEKFKAKQAAKKAMKKEAVEEKTLTPAEKKKREEIAKAMERENPGMDMRKKMAIATWQAKKVAEAKDPNEYDKEGDMMKNQLRQICSANEKLMKMVGDDDNLPEWVQNKVTKATDYIRSVRDYLDAENGNDEEEDDEEDDEDESMKESVELDEISRDLARRYIRKVADKTNTGELSTKQVMKRKPGVTLAGKKAYPGVAGEPKVRATESVEQIDELDKKTLGSYIKKASTNQIGNTAAVLAGKNDPETERARKRMGQRMSGIAKATDKLTKEEAEQIDELSKKTLGSYVKKAKDDLGNREAEVTRNRYADPRGVKDPVKYNNALLMKRANRRDNINKAVDKLTKEEVKSSDKKPEKYTRPDGKVAYRMVVTDKKVIKND